MPIALSRLYVSPGTVTPLSYGLMSVATLVDDTDQHWRAGIQYQPEICDDAQLTTDGCPVGDTPIKTFTSDGIPTIGAEPFTAYTWIDCSPIGNFWEEAEARTRTALLNGEARAVEAGFWTGTTDAGPNTVRPHLAEDTAVFDPPGTLVQPAAVISVTGAPLVVAIGALEDALGDCYGGVGVIHAPRQLGAHFADHTQIERTGAQLRTMLGTSVAFGAGYPGTSPAGAAATATSVWMYATGAVSVRRSAVGLTSTRPEALDRTENNLRLIAERTYVIGWDCCLFAAEVNPTL